MFTPLSQVKNLYFPEDTQKLNINTYFECLKYDHELLLRHARESRYKRISFITISGKNPQEKEDNNPIKFETYQTNICLQNIEEKIKEEKFMYKISSTTCEDLNLLEIYSHFLAMSASNFLTSETGVLFSVLPMNPGLLAVAPHKSIELYLEAKHGK